ncbi:MAG: hypothetical protein MUD01_20645 [Chloroflexaceae bacterium]|jgi:hypothetical protein|nr:hypothetical protein [Chloroflexaceae bacterium]
MKLRPDAQNISLISFISFANRHSSLVTRHSSLVTRHSSLVTMPKSLRPETQRLIAMLDEAAAILNRSDWAAWALMLQRNAAGLRRGERESLSTLMRAYGGMGSFNDFFVEGAEGQRFDELRSAIYDLALELRRLPTL